MAIPRASPHDSSSNKVAMEVKTKLMKKKQRGILACNKFIKNENTDSVNDQTIRIKGNWIHPVLPSPWTEQRNFSQNCLPRSPSCVKFMLRSHVTGGFWLSLPKSFTDLHLPNHDATVVLVDEKNEEYSTKYLVEKNGLSAGWRRFSIAHKLLEGDVLVFQLITPCRIKVYIVRANSLSEIDGAIGLLNSELKDKPINNGRVVNTIVKEENQDLEDVNNNLSVASQKKVVMEPCMTSCHQEIIAKNSLKGLNDNEVVPASESDAQSGKENGLVPAEQPQSGNKTDGSSGPEMFDGIMFSETVLDFKDIQDLESFSILVDGLVIDSELPKHLRTKYYDLCCSQNSFLHDHLGKGLNCKLAAGIISETVNIADAIRATKLDRCCDYLQTWDKTLKAFEDIGMAVGFLRDRIKKLLCLQREEQEIIKLKTLERDQVEINEKNLEAELVRVKEVKRNLDAEIEALKVKNENLVVAFKEMATAPW